VRELFKHEDFQFGCEIALGSAYRGHAEVGEVLSTAGRVRDGDADEWVREWCATAGRLEPAAKEAEAAGAAGQRPRPVPAGGHLLLDRAVPDHPCQRARAPARHLEAAPGLLGQAGRPGPGARGAALGPV
jgi:hypothetical protein